MRALILRDTIPWFGSHTGYEQLTTHLKINTSLVEPRNSQLFRYVGSAFDLINMQTGGGIRTFSELEFVMRRKIICPTVSHILYSESHLSVIERWKILPRNVVLTLHHPQKIWSQSKLDLLRRVQSAIVLYQKDIPFFEQYVGSGRIKFIRYGVDTTFFIPCETRGSDNIRLLFSGVYLRNNPMLVRIVGRLHRRHPELRFDFLIPEHARSNIALSSLQNHPAVTWHSNLNDLLLRNLYQKAYLLLLPMTDSGANTAVVEALSTGLPVVTTDVGGIRDYGGGTIFPLVENDDDDAMIEIIETYLENPRWHSNVSRECRMFAEQQLNWHKIADAHVVAYNELI